MLTSISDNEFVLNIFKNKKNYGSAKQVEFRTRKQNLKKYFKIVKYGFKKTKLFNEFWFDCEILF